MFPFFHGAWVINIDVPKDLRKKSNTVTFSVRMRTQILIKIYVKDGNFKLSHGSKCLHSISLGTFLIQIYPIFCSYLIHIIFWGKQVSSCAQKLKLSCDNLLSEFAVASLTPFFTISWTMNNRQSPFICFLLLTLLFYARVSTTQNTSLSSGKRLWFIQKSWTGDRGNARFTSSVISVELAWANIRVYSTIYAVGE